MKKKHLLFTMLALSLGCLSGGSGAMAQTSWDYVYTQEQTTSDTWTALSEGSTTGMTLGGSGTISYYRLTKSLNFSNTTAGGSGLTILGTVYLYLPAGVNITCTGANANGATGAGAGIELAEGNTLYIIGGGNGATVTATGGNAANGGNGGTGSDATGVYCSSVTSGVGGTGGNGGGGAGAGIGTRGGNGGTGGAGGGSVYTNSSSWVSGKDGSNGTAGTTADGMGNLYVDQTFGITVNATGGSAGTIGGNGGGRGRGRVDDDDDNYGVAGGGGGGGGGFGGAASNIGTGGPGGGGGGGGAGGQITEKKSGWYDATAYGGNGGQNADDSDSPSYAGNGTEALTSGQTYNEGWVDTNNNNWDSDDYNSGGEGNPGHGGSGGGTGNSCANGTTNAGEKTYTITLQPTKTKVNGSNLDAVTETYTPSTLTTFILPKNKSGYQWALLVYGKSCKADGTAGSVFTTATKEFFGGEETDDAYRTVVLNDVYGDMTFVEVATTCKLKSSGDNTETLTDFFYNKEVMSQKYPVTVRLQNRTLYTDDKYNTLCLPFGMTPSQFDISILQGATIYEMNTTATGYYPDGTQIPDAMYKKEGPVLYLKFDLVNASTNGLEAGKPYLVKWTSGINYVDNTSDGNTRHEVDFYNVTVTKLAPQAPAANGVTFQGTFSSSATLTAGDKTKLILGADNKLYYPSKNINVGACRAYFIIPAAAASAREVVMDFNNEDVITSINMVKGSGVQSQDSDTFFNLNGQRLSAPKKGINIVNGKKVLVK
ncbi:MAG: hypothetical protein IJ069_11785 [Prevotella sp.]|nr:hypothetical protein [Prevotella sp.]